MFELLIKRNFIKNINFIIVIGIFVIFLVPSVQAAGVTNMAVTLSPSTTNTATSMTITFTPNAATSYSNSSVISIAWTASTFSGGASLVCSGACTGAAGDDVAVTKSGDGNFTSASLSGASATGFNLTLTTGGTLSTSNAFSIVIGGGTNVLTTPASAQNVNVYFTTSGGTNSTNDFGAGLAYVGSANKVTVDANIGQTMSFAIRDSTDSTTVTSCALGSLSTTTVNVCQYRLKVGTNAQSGYTVQYSAATGLQKTSPTYTFTNAAAAGTGGTLTGGTEAYGVNISPGSATGGGSVTSTNYNCNVAQANCNALTGATTQAKFYRYDSSSPLTFYTSTVPNSPSGTDLTNTALVTHGATPSGGTPAGSYTSVVTYTVTGSF